MTLVFVDPRSAEPPYEQMPPAKRRRLILGASLRALATTTALE